MKFIIKLFPEITIKSKSVRQRFIKILQGNIRNVLRRFDDDARVRMDWDKLIVSSRNDQFREQAIEALACIPAFRPSSRCRPASLPTCTTSSSR